MTTPIEGFYSRLAQPAMLALARAGNRGCRIDTTLRDRLAAEAEQRKQETAQALAKAVGHAVNPDSPKQVQALLYDELHLPVQRKRQAGGLAGPPTSDEEAIRALRRLAPQYSTLLTLLLDYRGFSKEASQLRIPLEHRDDGDYFITSYNATGTTTGRISSSEHILGYGGNLQNQKRGPSRRIFIPRPGMIFVKADASQAEARVVAALCRDTALLQRFANPSFDIHLENAQLIYGGTVEELQREDKEWKAAVAKGTSGVERDSRRQRTKGVTHGANYRGGPRVAMKQADIPFSEAKVAIERYRLTHPLLLKWWERVEECLRTTRRMTTCWGRQRLFLGRLDDSTLREATAHEPQSTVGDLINHAFFRLDASLVNAWPLLQSHDEIVCECRPSEREAVAEALREELEMELDIHGLRLSIPAEVSWGENWYDQEKVRS